MVGVLAALGGGSGQLGQPKDMLEKKVHRCKRYAKLLRGSVAWL